MERQLELLLPPVERPRRPVLTRPQAEIVRPVARLRADDDALADALARALIEELRDR